MVMAARQTLLQWGRNFSVAEGGQQFEALTVTALLQWGRNFSVAEGGAWAAAP